MLKQIEQELEDLRNSQYKNELVEFLPEGDTAAEYLKVEDMVKKFVQPDHNWYPEVTKIFYSCKHEIIRSILWNVKRLSSIPVQRN